MAAGYEWKINGSKCPPLEDRYQLRLAPAVRQTASALAERRQPEEVCHLFGTPASSTAIYQTSEKEDRFLGIARFRVVRIVVFVALKQICLR